LVNKHGRTVLRTIRIEKELDDVITQDAKRNKLSFNSYISKLMTRYSEWDRFNERWGAISIRKEAFKSIIEAIESDKLVDVAKDIGSHVPKEFIVFWFKKINLETYLEYLSLVCHYAKFAECEIANDGNEYTIILSHDIGQKWSDFLGVWLTEGLKITLGVLPKIDITRNSIVARFHI
jgi:hypothetical protein